jgi:hypothetical protein
MLVVAISNKPRMEAVPGDSQGFTAKKKLKRKKTN